MARIRWTDEAQFWLQDIHTYIARDNFDAANRLVEGIFNKVLARESKAKYRLTSTCQMSKENRTPTEESLYCWVD